MTERWRKKLGSLDGVGPDDGLLDRAKAGPARPEEPIELPSGRSRVITGVAAFAVFALAISVFVVPALRFNGEGDAARSAAAGVHPLWPMGTTDEVTSWQSRADGGRDAWVTDPQQVASAFATNVMGWKAGTAIPPASSISGNAVVCVDPATGQALAIASCPPIGSSSPSGWFAYGRDSGTGSPTGTIRYLIVSCPWASCEGMVFRTWVTLYQPGEVGAGKVWAVLSVEDGEIDLATAVGSTVRDGDVVTAGARLAQEHTLLGYRASDPSCAIAGGTDTYEAPQTNGDVQMGTGGFELRVHLPTAGTNGCGDTEPGYVYVLSTPTPGDALPDPSTADPFSFGTLGALAAVPVEFRLPAPATSVASPSTAVSPTLAWTTYTDPMGWTIDVPADWQTLSYDGSSGVPADAKGASFFSGQPSVTPGGPFSATPGPGDVMLRVFHRDSMDPIGDDSTFPLSTDPFEQQLGSGSPTLGWIQFQGDGVTFQVDITFGDGADPNTYWPDLKRMVRSIRFEPFQQGDIVNGYVALMPAEQIADNVPKMVQTQDGTQWAVSTTDTTGSQIRVIALPATACEDHGNPGPTDWTMQMGSLHVRCGDGLEASYTGGGDPDPNNPETWIIPLPSQPAVISWDGWVLAPLTSSG